MGVFGDDWAEFAGGPEPADVPAGLRRQPAADAGRGDAEGQVAGQRPGRAPNVDIVRRPDDAAEVAHSYVPQSPMHKSQDL